MVIPARHFVTKSPLDCALPAPVMVMTKVIPAGILAGTVALIVELFTYVYATLVLETLLKETPRKHSFFPKFSPLITRDDLCHYHYRSRQRAIKRALGHEVTGRNHHPIALN